jgi:hypothetical protein
MVPAPAFAAAAEIFRDLPGIALGLHVDLNAEWEQPRWGPVLPPGRVPSLVDDAGYFFQTTAELDRCAPALEEMQAEVRAQLDRARRAGLDIVYLDEHMGVGWINGLSAWLDDLCAREGLVCNRALLEGGALLRLPLGDAGTPVDRVVHALNEVEPGAYLLVGHPVTITEEMTAAHLPGQAPGVEARARDGQRRMMMDPAVVQAVRELGVVPVRYTDL